MYLTSEQQECLKDILDEIDHDGDLLCFVGDEQLKISFPELYDKIVQMYILNNEANKLIEHYKNWK